MFELNILEIFKWESYPYFESIKSFFKSLAIIWAPEDKNY